MALTTFQRDVCRLLADNRIRSGESYVAGGAALNEVRQAPRVSKDPGFSPRAILEHAAGSTRYAAPELAGLAFEGETPDPGDLLRRWHTALRSAPEIVSRPPPEDAGKAVLARDGRLFRGDAAELDEALGSNALLFHEGAIKGAFPQIVR